MVPLLPARTVGTKGGTTAGVSLCMESHRVRSARRVRAVAKQHKHPEAADRGSDHQGRCMPGELGVNVGKTRD